MNALLKFEISATWNCKRVTANCGLRFPMKNLMLKVSIRCRTMRRKNSYRCLRVVTLTCGKRYNYFFRISSSFIPCCASVFTFVCNTYFSKSSSLNQLCAILVYCYLNWRSSSCWTLQPETLHCSDGRTREMYFGLFCDNNNNDDSN